ncbi:MAG: hypothetical protein ACRC2T_15945 [Thermoguttaceae bacterium]
MSKPEEKDFDFNDMDLSADFSDLSSDSDSSADFSDFGSDDFSDPGTDFSDFSDQAEDSESPFDSAFTAQDDISDVADAEGEFGAVAGAAAAVAEEETGKKGKKAKKEKAPKVKKEKAPKVKKEKPPKVKKEKPPKPPRDPNAPGMQLEDMVAIAACVLLAVIFGIANVLVIMGGLAGGSMVFLIGMDVIAAIAIMVPLIVLKFRKTVSIFEVSLGAALIAVCIGAILLFAVWSRYDFNVNKAKTAKLVQPHHVAAQFIAL